MNATGTLAYGVETVPIRLVTPAELTLFIPFGVQLNVLAGETVTNLVPVYRMQSVV
jgi:hypothetical protein